MKNSQKYSVQCGCCYVRALLGIIFMMELLTQMSAKVIQVLPLGMYRPFRLYPQFGTEVAVLAHHPPPENPEQSR